MTPIAYLCGQFEGVDNLEARKYLGMFGLDGARHLINISELSGGNNAIKIPRKVAQIFDINSVNLILIHWNLIWF